MIKYAELLQKIHVPDRGHSRVKSLTNKSMSINSRNFRINYVKYIFPKPLEIMGKKSIPLPKQGQ